MLNYIIRRIVYIVFVFFIVSVIIFSLYKLSPADPVKMYTEGLQNEMRPADFERYQQEVRAFLGLDQPLVVQYFKWMGKMLVGDFGRSLLYRQPVVQVIKAPMSNTLMLNAITMLFVFIITIPLGITTAVKKGTIYDSSVQVVTILGLSLPSFIISLAAILIFSVLLGWLPIGGAYTPGFRGTGFALTLDKLKHMILPIGVMVFTSLGSLTRYIRATMIDALRMDYIRTARAKGLTEKVVIYSHAFRNSMIPFMTILISWFLSLFGGSIMIERIFNWNGMGNLYISSIMVFDYAVALTLSMFYVLIGLIGNLIIDIAYTFVDPRIRFS
ncbi:MAG: ABC transporter permease [Treponema sp.]|nr:ABC transporter permease [Treponema sp.]